MLTVDGELARLFGGAGTVPESRNLRLSPNDRREAWILEQRLSPTEAVGIPLDYDPAFPYPPERHG